MGISITLFIQALNFFAAYCVIRFFIFKPLVALILAQKAYHNGLEQAVVQAQGRQKEQENAVKLLWQKCREQFERVRPSLEKPIEHHVTPEIAPISEKLDAHVEAQLIEKTSKGLAQRICK